MVYSPGEEALPVGSEGMEAMSDAALETAERAARADPTDLQARARLWKERKRVGRESPLAGELRALLLGAGRLCAKARRLSWDSVIEALNVLRDAPLATPTMPGEGFAFEIRIADEYRLKDVGGKFKHHFGRPRMIFMAAKFQIGGALLGGEDYVMRCATVTGGDRDYVAARRAWPVLFTHGWPKSPGRALKRWREWNYTGRAPTIQGWMHRMYGRTFPGGGRPFDGVPTGELMRARDRLDESLTPIPDPEAFIDPQTRRVLSRQDPQFSVEIRPRADLTKQPRYQKVEASREEMLYFLLGAPSGELQ